MTMSTPPEKRWTIVEKEPTASEEPSALSTLDADNGDSTTQLNTPVLTPVASPNGQSSGPASPVSPHMIGSKRKSSDSPKVADAPAPGSSPKPATQPKHPQVSRFISNRHKHHKYGSNSRTRDTSEVAASGSGTGQFSGSATPPGRYPPSRGRPEWPSMRELSDALPHTPQNSAPGMRFETMPGEGQEHSQPFANHVPSHRDHFREYPLADALPFTSVTARLLATMSNPTIGSSTEPFHVTLAHLTSDYEDIAHFARKPYTDLVIRVRYVNAISVNTADYWVDSRIVCGKSAYIEQQCAAQQISMNPHGYQINVDDHKPAAVHTALMFTYTRPLWKLLEVSDAALDLLNDLIKIGIQWQIPGLSKEAGKYEAQMRKLLRDEPTRQPSEAIFGASVKTEPAPSSLYRTSYHSGSGPSTFNRHSSFDTWPEYGNLNGERTGVVLPASFESPYMGADLVIHVSNSPFGPVGANELHAQEDMMCRASARFKDIPRYVGRNGMNHIFLNPSDTMRVVNAFLLWISGAPWAFQPYTVVGPQPAHNHIEDQRTLLFECMYFGYQWAAMEFVEAATAEYKKVVQDAQGPSLEHIAADLVWTYTDWQTAGSLSVRRRLLEAAATRGVDMFASHACCNVLLQCNGKPFMDLSLAVSDNASYLLGGAQQASSFRPPQQNPYDDNDAPTQYGQTFRTAPATEFGGPSYSQPRYSGYGQ